MFVSRQRHAPDSNLGWKIATLGVAAVLIFFGVRLKHDWLIWSAIGVLMLGFVLRFLPRERKDRSTNTEDSQDEASG